MLREHEAGGTGLDLRLRKISSLRRAAEDEADRLDERTKSRRIVGGRFGKSGADADTVSFSRRYPLEHSVSGRAIVVGGSIAGLFAAAALRRAGWEVEVHERSPVTLAGRGAGIVTHAELIAALEAVGADTTALGVEVLQRAAYDITGARVRASDFRQIVTSWDWIYRALRALVPDGCYHLGRTASGYEQRNRSVICRFAEGGATEGDILVGADGFRSGIRAQMLPNVVPSYAGYVAWRTLAAEKDLPEAVRRDIFQVFGFFIPNGTQIIGYPIAGPENDLRPGHLRYNFVWYSEVPEMHLEDMLTDARGVRHPISIPPPAIRSEVIDAMYADARERLPALFNDILVVSERPFFTPIYDHWSPVMAEGRVALSGDAACVARPHVGMGVTKAAEDALALVGCLSIAPVDDALQAYSDMRVGPCRLACETAQRLGGYIFGGVAGENTDGRSHPQIETVMRETAVVPKSGRSPGARSSS